MAQTPKEIKIMNLLTTYVAAFPGAKVDQKGLQFYSQSLSDLPISLIHAALESHLQRCRFFPTVAEILDRAESLALTASHRVVKSPGAAWAEVVQELHRSFIYREPSFSSAAIRKAAVYMGWNALCMLSVQDVNAARAQFMTIYQSILEQEKINRHNQLALNKLSHREKQSIRLSMNPGKHKIDGQEDTEKPAVPEKPDEQVEKLS